MKKDRTHYAVFAAFITFSILSLVFNFSFGIKIWDNFLVFAKDMVFILPPAFILIGLFDVWAKNETVKKHFGSTSNPLRFVWAVLLAATTVGGTFVAFPVANALYHKGARYSSILSYVTAASLFMIPMSIMEAGMLGIKFTLIRLVSSLPFIFIGAIFLEKYLVKDAYVLPLMVDPNDKGSTRS
jgi:uncharacterized membrane protein YraQ (UPF0718 family)